jgi:hypothetical protein
MNFKHSDEFYASEALEIGRELGDRRRPTSNSNGHGRNDPTVPDEGPDISGGTDSTAALLDDVRAIIRRFVVLTTEQVIAVVLWILHTHAIDAADATPYLQITSATKMSGKTRLLEVMERLVRRPWMTGRTSAAALVRKIDVDAPSLLLDESDAAFKGEKEYAEALRGILNSGYTRKGKASLCVGKGADLSVRDFSTFSAKALAGIGNLPDTVANRCIPIVLKRRMTNELVERWHERDGRALTMPIHHRLVRWSGTETVTALRAARPALPSQLSDRAQDVWEPLLAIADMAGGEWPESARKAAVVLMGAVEDLDPVVDLLIDLQDILAEYPMMPEMTSTIISTKDLIEKLTAREDRPWASWRHDKPITGRGLARLLGPLGIHPIHLRTARGYRVDAFTEAFARYLPSQASQCHNANNDGPESCDGCVSETPSQNASVTGFEADSIGSVTHRHIDPGDDGEDHF